MFATLETNHSDSGVRIRCSIIAWPLMPFAPVTKATFPGGTRVLIWLFMFKQMNISREWWLDFSWEELSYLYLAYPLQAETWKQMEQTAVWKSGWSRWYDLTRYYCIDPAWSGDIGIITAIFLSVDTSSVVNGYKAWAYVLERPLNRSPLVRWIISRVEVSNSNNTSTVNNGWEVQGKHFIPARPNTDIKALIRYRTLTAMTVGEKGLSSNFIPFQPIGITPHLMRILLANWKKPTLGRSPLQESLRD